MRIERLTRQPTMRRANTSMVGEIQQGLDADERKFLLSLVAGTPEYALLNIPHLEHLPGGRWKLQNLAQLRKTHPKKFTEQADLLTVRLPTLAASEGEHPVKD